MTIKKPLKKLFSRDRRHMSISNILLVVVNIFAILGMIGTLVVFSGSIAADNADTKRRLTTVEQRQEEERKNLKETAHEIKTDVKEAKSDVQKILLKLEAIEALQRRAERR